MYSDHPTGRPPTPLPGSKILSKKNFTKNLHWTSEDQSPGPHPPPGSGAFYYPPLLF